MDLHGMVMPQTTQAGHVGLFKERSFLGMDVQELTSLIVCNQTHSRDSGHSADMYSLSDHRFPVARSYTLDCDHSVTKSLSLLLTLKSGDKASIFSLLFQSSKG
jgi:hypothetical protein